MMGLCCTTDGQTVCLGEAHAVRAIDLSMVPAAVSTIVISKPPHVFGSITDLAFGRKTVIPESELYATTVAGLIRIELPLAARVMHRWCCERCGVSQPWLLLELWMIVAQYLTQPTASWSKIGNSDRDCDALDVATAGTWTWTCLAGWADERDYVDGPGGIARFDDLGGIAIVDQEQCAYVCDWSNRRIRRITLPQRFFFG